jgi:cobalt transporter subunit CbtA
MAQRMTRVIPWFIPATERPRKVFKLFRGMFYSALLAGILAGVLLTLIQEVTVKPLIAQAEVLEELAEPGHVHADGHHPLHTGQAHDPSEPSEDDEVRLFYTAISNVLVGTGYALLLAACFSQLQTVNWRIGLLWGMAGFTVFQLAPALGLPPELPGAPHAPLAWRQAWWLSAVLATASGLWLLWQGGKRHKAIMLIAGGVLVALPHLVGAPSTSVPSTLPETLTQQFIVMVMLTAAVFWSILGSSLGYIYARLTQGQRS